MCEHDQKYRLACYICGTTTDVMMYAHRHIAGGPICGWLMACAKCAPSIINADVIVKQEYEDPKSGRKET
jgi:hypothetical protein